MPIFLGDLLQSAAERLPGKEAIVYNGTRTTWCMFNQQVNNLACALLRLGIQRGDRIGVISTTRPEYLCVYMAAARIGAVMVGFSIYHTATELKRLAHLTRPTVMMVLDKVNDRPLAAPIKPTFDTMDFVRDFIVMGDDRLDGASSLQELMKIEHPDGDSALARRRSELNRDDGVLIVFTSGSTGEPKATVLTHRSIIDNILVQARQFGFREDDCVLQNKPMNHVGGTTNLTLPAIAVGATLVFMDYFHPVRTLEIIQRERITILGQVPTMFIMEMNLPNFTDYDLSSLRRALVAGAPTPPPIMYRIIDMASSVITGYGMTEVGGYVTYTATDDDPTTIAATVGAIAPEFELRVVDNDRQSLTVGTTGEVVIRGSCVFKEYFDNPAATAEVKDADGWFYTGDLGYLDQRGYLTLVDRKKEMYISGGYNIYPREIEQHLSLHPAVALSAVIAVPDAVMGEVGLAFVVPIPGSEITIDDVKIHCMTGLASYKIPRYFIIRESLPLTSLGKIDKERLRQEGIPDENLGN
jgi:acyl-CoA synthetase (AMP-forming)/AMP-acid ligase II